MTHTFMYPQVTQTARGAHGVPASRLLRGRPVRGTGDFFGPPVASRRASSGPLALGVSTRATS
jgi:hypothetical protein